MSWVRLWHDMPTDPKFRTIARVSGQPLSLVVSTYVFMMVDASSNKCERNRTQPNATERGRTHANDENIASAFDVSDADIAAIREAMQGRVLDGNRLTGWETRQPRREDGSAARSKAWRESKKINADANATERNRTQPNATERPDIDTDKIQIRKERKDSRSVSCETRPAVSGDAGDKFLEFWKAIPRRQGSNPRKPAEQKFRSLVKTGVDADFLICEAGKWADAEARAGKIGTPYVAQVTTWLNQQRWIDHAALGLIGKVNEPGSVKLNEKDESRMVLDELASFASRLDESNQIGNNDLGLLRFDTGSGQESIHSGSCEDADWVQCDGD